MITLDTYCLVPEGADLAPILTALFLFVDVVYRDDSTGHHPVESAEAAAKMFDQRLEDGDLIRFPKSTVPDTAGGWLYRLEDGSAVIALSGDMDAEQPDFEAALQDAIPDGVCCAPSNEPPPDTREAFLDAAP